jgi:Transposase
MAQATCLPLPLNGPSQIEIFDFYIFHMRTSRYSEEQTIGFLRQFEAGMPIKEVGRKHGFSDASFYK